MSLYPLKFVPRLVEKMWGGRKLQEVLGKPLPPQRLIGESWELYDFPPGVVNGVQGWVSAAVANGPLAGRTLRQLIEDFGSSLLGDVKLVNGGQFPVLIKFLDARETLSLQVHPDAQYVAEHPGTHLKTEAWYVVQADAGASIWAGLRPGLTKEVFAQAIERGAVERMVHRVPAREGQCIYLPSGTVHALGAGILVAEVQTPSDTTFRISDFGRIDPGTGQPRQLHVAEALECIDFSAADRPLEQPRSHVGGYHTTITRLVSCPHFTIEKVRFSEGFEQPVPYDRPVVWIGLDGQAQVSVKGLKEPVRFGRGETILLPAQMDAPVLRTLSDCVWLEVTL
jgi:mannose-6-phosphate isomerase